MLKYGSGGSGDARMAFMTAQKYFAKSSYGVVMHAASDTSDSGTLLIRIRSWFFTKCGLVKSPVRRPHPRRIDSANVQVDPFPFVPVTWMTFSWSRSPCLIPRSSRYGWCSWSGVREGTPRLFGEAQVGARGE